MKRRRSAELWQPYTASDGVSVMLPPFLLQMLRNDELRPDPRTDFSSLLSVQVGSQITAKHLGQVPKYFGQGYQGKQFFVTEQMMQIWGILASDSEFPVKKVLSGPMGVGKSYLAWFLAAQAYANGWPVLYISDAAVLDQGTAERSSIEICKRFLALNKDIITAAELKEMVTFEDTTTPLVISCAETIFESLLQRQERKTLCIIDEQGALFESSTPAPDRFVVLQPLKTFNRWKESSAGARVVFTGTAHAKFERVHLKDETPLVYVGPLSPTTFIKLQAAVFSHFHSTVRGYASDIGGEVLRITNCVPRELVNLAQEIGTTPLTLQQVKERLEDFEGNRRSTFYRVIETHYNALTSHSKEGTRLALANMFLPGKIRPTATFDWKFLDFGIVYRYHGRNSAAVLHHPICPAAQNALLDLYKRCPLPEAYRNGLARDSLDGAQFEDALFQQLIRAADVMLKATDLAGLNSMDLHLKISGYELLQDPPIMVCTDGMNLLMRCYAGYPQFDFILGYKFFQVSISNFVSHDQGSAKIEKAFERNGDKNQIEEYLDAVYGGTHKANIELQHRGHKTTKRFVVSRDGQACLQFKIIYICGRGDAPNHSSKAKEYPDLRYISYNEIKSKLFGASLWNPDKS